MSDLISREFLQTAIHNFFNGLKHTPTEEDIQRYIEVAPPADITEHARAIKEYCEQFPECEGCRFYKELPFRCTFGICPQEWDLPERGKK